MCVNTYFDIPELLKYPLPFKAEDILLDSDFALQDGHQPPEHVFKNATKKPIYILKSTAILSLFWIIYVLML